AVVEESECPAQRDKSHHAWQRICFAHRSGRQYFCGRSEFPSGIRAELASVRTARYARRIDRHRDVFGREGNSRTPTLLSEHVSHGRGESVPALSFGICVSDVQRKFHAACWNRRRAAALASW